jgi:hypothetical protein
MNHVYISFIITSFSVSYILSEIEIFRFAQNDISRSADLVPPSDGRKEQRKNCHPERSEGSLYSISEKLVKPLFF